MSTDAPELETGSRNGATPGFARRLARWVNRPWSEKLVSVEYRVVQYLSPLLVPALRLAARRSGRILRSWQFDALGPLSDVLLSNHGKEKFVVLTYDKSISKDLYVRGNAEFAKLTKAINVLGSGFVLETLVDVGANIGTICIPAVKRGLAKSAIAFEPEPRNFRALMTNIWLNDLDRDISAHNMALGAEPNQTLQMELSAGNSGDHRIRVTAEPGQAAEASRAVIAVRSGRLDDALPALDARTTLIFMDTQGYEGHVLAGAEAVIRARMPIVLELWPYAIERAASYDGLMSAVARYDRFHDLAEADPIGQPTASIGRFYEMTKRAGGYTDILLT
jgi:FkbM family methyltransferase